jgi:hypothetical protein
MQETINRVPTRMRDKLTAVLADTTAPKEQRSLAAKVLSLYQAQVADPKESDIEVKTMLAEWNADFIWSGLRTIKEVEGEDIVVSEINPDAPAYNPLFNKNQTGCGGRRAEPPSSRMAH